MATADMNRLVDNVRIRCPGVLDTAIYFELFSILNDFLQVTNLWTEDINFAVTGGTDSYYVNPDLYTYTLDVFEGGTINRLLALSDSNGTPKNGSMAIPGVIILQYPPAVTTTYVAKVAKTITDPTQRDGTPELPDWIINKYGNSILDGVLGRLMSQLAKPYSSPQMAVTHLKLYFQVSASAKTEALHKNIQNGQTWKFPGQFSTRGQQR